MSAELAAYSCVVCRTAIELDDIERMHSDDETGEDVHEQCCRDCEPL